jgi:putative copper resistance protein D
MDWFGAGIDGPLVVIRAIHFAATAITTGTLIFRAVVVGPTTSAARPAAVLVRAKTLGVARIGLVIAAASGVIWLLLEAKSMSGLPFREAMTPDVLFTVVNETQFGLVAEIRLVVAVILAGCLAVERLPPARGLALAMSLGLIAALAWTGHAGSTLGEGRIPHLTADILHLFAAATWLGGLISLVILLSVARRDQILAGASFARDATQGFSTLGIASVVMVFATGAVNAWILVGSLRALVGTGYGRLLMLKMMLFAVMLLIAAVNRFWLTPRLASPGGELHAVHQLTRNSVIEIVLALMIFTIVGLLGTLHPAIHLLPVR